MDFLRNVHPGVFFFALFMVLFLAGGMGFAAVSSRRKVAAIAGVTAVPPSNLAPGYRLVFGRATGPALTAPLTGRPCVWYKAQVWASQREIRDGKSEWRWQDVGAETPERGIEIRDGTVSCLVHHDGAEVHGSGWSEWTGAESPPTERNPPLHPGSETPGGGLQVSVQGTFGPRFRFRETIIAQDTPVFALGDCAVAEALPLAEGEERDELELYPEELNASWVMRQAKGKPFLISTSQPDAVMAEAELAGKTAVPFALAFAALAAFMLWARFGG
jgi:hypothetical protein